MSAEMIWTLPMRGDGRRARREEWNRGGWNAALPQSPAWITDDRRSGRLGPFDHLESAVRAAEHGGFDGLLVPHDPEGEESWIVATVAVRSTRWARAVVELQPADISPVYAAKLAATFQRIAAGRLDWNLAVDGDRLTLADEFLTVARGVWQERGFAFHGRHYTVEGGGLGAPLNDGPFPRIFLTGHTSDALGLSARHADVHLLDGMRSWPDLAALDDVVAELARRAAAAGRPAPRLGLTLPVIGREDGEEAWAHVLALVKARGGGEADLDLLRDGATRWSGFGRLGFRSRCGLVGSYADIDAELGRCMKRGVEVFVLDSFPHVEEAYRLGQRLLGFLAQPPGDPVAS